MTITFNGKEDSIFRGDCFSTVNYHVIYISIARQLNYFALRDIC